MVTSFPQKKKKNDKANRCPMCQEKRGKAESLGVILLLVTVVGCGLPGIVTIPLMIFLVIKAAIPCEKCRSTKRGGTAQI